MLMSMCIQPSTRSSSSTRTPIERIQQGMEEKLLNNNASRTFYSQKLLPRAGVTLEMFENKEKALALHAGGQVQLGAGGAGKQ